MALSRAPGGKAARTLWKVVIAGGVNRCLDGIRNSPTASSFSCESKTANWASAFPPVSSKPGDDGKFQSGIERIALAPGLVDRLRKLEARHLRCPGSHTIWTSVVLPHWRGP